MQVCFKQIVTILTKKYAIAYCKAGICFIVANSNNKRRINFLKKFLCFAFTILLSCASIFAFVGCNNNQSKMLRINEVTHSIFYAPLYVAINNGYLREYGIETELVNGGGSDISMTALLSGQADIALMGPETVVYVAAGGSTNYPKVFGQLTKRDGSFLVSKHQEQNFEWSNLQNKTVIAGRRGGLPAMTFEWVCNTNKLYRDVNITLDTDTSFTMMVPVFEATDADYCTMFEPTASEFVAAGKGYIVASVGEQSGEIPYTCFMAKPSFLKANEQLAINFLKAINKAYKFIVEQNSTLVAQSLQPSFTSTSIESLKMAIESYKAIDAWTSNPAMTEDSYIRLLQVIANASELQKNVGFSEVVDNTYANKI